MVGNSGSSISEVRPMSCEEAAGEDVVFERNSGSMDVERLT